MTDRACGNSFARRAAAWILAVLAAAASALALAPQTALAETDLTQVSVLLDGEVTDNVSDNDLTTVGDVVDSYLYEDEDGTLTRVEFTVDGVLVEEYSSDYELVSSQTLDYELSYLRNGDEFGGFYAGEDYNYLVYGQNNSSESNSKTVMRVVEYSKDWVRIDSCSISGINTYAPFSSGSLRMTELDGKLYIHTCHKMYADEEDGENAQANMTFVIDESSMEVEDSYYDVSDIGSGSVSNSLNQFIQTDGESIYRVDLGDGDPRAVVITQIDADDKVTSVGSSYTYALEIQGTGGASSTGVSVGGFELSSDNCLIVGNSVDQSDEDSYDAEGQRNIFLTVTDKDDISTSSETEIVWLTDYDEDDGITPRTPQLVKLGDDEFLVMWEEYDEETEDVVTRMVTVDGDGKLTSAVESAAVRLSDCQPIVTSDGYVCWYVTDSSAYWPSDDTVTLYTIDPDNLEDLAALTDGVSWSIDDDGVLTLYPTNGVSGTMRSISSTDEVPWYDERESITKVVIEEGVRAGVQAEYLFYGCTNLTGVEGMDNFDLSCTTNLRCLFFGCTSLESLDVSGWDTSSVENLDYTFYNCSSLTSLDVSGWDTSNVTSLWGAFEDCSSLVSLDLSDWDTSKVTSLWTTFDGCSSLTSLDVSGWDTSAVTTMYRMFYYCSSLTSLDLSGWDTSNVTSMYSAFEGCSSLTSLDLSEWDTSSVTETRSMFEDCTSLESLDVSGWDTSSVTTMWQMFYFCTSLESLDVSGWDTSAVTTMYRMFYYCSSLTSLDVSGWDTSSVENLDYTFYNCSSLTSLDVSAWDTSSATSMIRTFGFCASLESLDVSGWDVSNAEKVTGIFGYCYSLESLDLSNWDLSGDLSSATNASQESQMFQGCYGLRRISVSDSIVFDDYNRLPTPHWTRWGIVYNGQWMDEDDGTVYSDVSDIPSETAATYVAVFDIGNADVTLNATEYEYTGSAIEPEMTVMLGSDELVEGEDYTVSYSDNVEVGTATVTITAIGDYLDGSVSVTFTIVEELTPSYVITYGADQTIEYGDRLTVKIAREDGESVDSKAFDHYNIDGEAHTDGYGYSVKSGIMTFYVSDGTLEDYSPGEHTLVIWFDDGYAETTFTIAEERPTATITRLYGNDRYATMEAIVSEAYGDGTSEYAVVASGANFADALSAASLAGAVDAPIVLVSPSDPSAAVDVLEGLGASAVYVVGGTSSVSSEFVHELDLAGIGWRRVKGDTRQETSVQVAKYTRSMSGDEVSTTAIVAAGSNFPDALSASPYSYWSLSPIYLAESDGSVSQEVLDDIEEGGYTDVVIMGGTSSVSNGAYTALEGVVGSGHVERIAGDSRYETSAAFAEWCVGEGMTFDGCAVATGTSYPDALAGATICGRSGSVLLLCNGSTVAGINAGNASDSWYGCFSDAASGVSQVYLLGGTGSVTKASRSTVEDALEGAGLDVTYAEVKK